jgi:hypothetical protein
MNATDRQLLGEFDLARGHWPEQLQLHRCRRFGDQFADSDEVARV